MCQLHRVYRSLKLISFVKSIKDKKINYSYIIIYYVSIVFYVSLILITLHFIYALFLSVNH